MSRQLRAAVHVKNPKTGTFESFAKGGKLPTWAIKALPDHVFTDEEPEQEPEEPVEDPDLL